MVGTNPGRRRLVRSMMATASKLGQPFNDVRRVVSGKVQRHIFHESGSAEAQEKQGVGLPEWEVVVLRRTATTGFSYIKIIV